MRSKRAQGTIDILREHGPLDIDALGRRLALTGATTARDPVKAALDAVSIERRAFQLTDGRWLDRVAALEGAMLLHRVTHLERWRSAIRMDPDLSVLAHLVVSPSPWSDADLPGVVSLGWVRDRRLDRHHAAPDRFLSIPYALARSLPTGGMVRVVVAEGSLTFEPVPGWQHPGDMSYPEVEAVVCDLVDVDPTLEPLGPIQIHRLVLELSGRAPDALRSLREPIGAMLHRSGLVTHRELVGVPTTDWDRYEHREEALHWAEQAAWRDERDRLDPDSDEWEGWPGSLMMDEVLLDRPA